MRIFCTYKEHIGSHNRQHVAQTKRFYEKEPFDNNLNNPDLSGIFMSMHLIDCEVSDSAKFGVYHLVL